jgi:uncharacterized delta-60 repeat protein
MRRLVGAVAFAVACGGSSGESRPDSQPDAESCTPYDAFDQSFGVRGFAIAPATAPYVLTADAVVLPDDRFVLVGRSSLAPHKFVLARYLVDGSLDPSFGTDGIAVHTFSTTGNGSEPWSIGLAPDGKLVVSGWIDGYAIARFNSDGSLDTTWPNGYVMAPAGERIVADANGIVTVSVNVSASPKEVVIARVTYAGELDTTFGSGGVVRDTIGGASPLQVRTFALAPDGRVIVAGVLETGALFMRRYSAQGVVEPSFPASQLAADVGVAAIQVLASGRIILALGKTIINEPTPGVLVGVAALTATGSLDTSFGQTGYGWSGRLMDTRATDLAVSSTGKITLTGVTAGGSQFMAARFGADGAPDLCFGDQGVGFGVTGESPASVIDSHDRITLAGSQYVDPINTRLVVSRVAP